MFDVEAIIAIVERGKADKLVDIAKKAGATGATIFYARGTSYAEAKKLFNLNIEASKEAILILSEREKSQPIIDALCEAGRLREPGTGIIFTMPITKVVGLHHRED
ncbi:MAG: P-II family nitrogen regulator [Bacillota bacterium]